MSRMKFGIFMAPFHPLAGQDPISAYQRDLEVIQHLDRLGFEEAWIGEHHSAGTEIIPDPMIFIAHCATQTRHINLGTGVLSLPYHNPLWVADRAIFLDNLTRGRFMLGLGPGALPGDAQMIGIEIEEQRTALEDDTDVLMHLLRSDEPLTVETPRYRLREAKSQYTPYTDFEIGVAAIASPTGPRIAGKHGLGMLSVGATAAAGFDMLAMHWDVVEERAKEFGTVADRSRWRLVGPMHIAETKEQAIEDVRYGLMDWAHYTQKILAVPHFRAAGETFEERIAWVNETGLGVIGTPDDAIAQIERLQKQSNGGFGSYLIMHNEWARPDAMKRSYELIANHVKPVFQGTAGRLVQAEQRAIGDWESLDGRVEKALAAASERHFGKKE
ncbi:LLM class flavin-dependent oxidoreductase [Cumulibacter soli]|uniref:LLM class flavin-dependent oxidoreductase n=1 Tax=Cumulibacter soli TaxID=2546344 RepID=UPI001067524B|nr:LLM class flavin-dependent oxidoreductase [Cumulibacter soli]